MTVKTIGPSAPGPELASALLNALGNDDMGEAEMWLDRLQELNQLDADHPDILVFRSLINIQRGRVVDALCHMNNLGDDVAPDVKVICMYYAQDPMWHGLATELADSSPHDRIRQSMSLLLGRSEQGD